jgi:uncharacterized protein YkwD
MRVLLATIACSLVVLSSAAAARGTLVDSINAVRAAGCSGNGGVRVPLRASGKLDTVAKGLSHGVDLQSALKGAGYRALHSSSVVVSGTEDNEGIASAIANRACGELRNAEVREIGIEKRGDSVWVVLAAPFEANALENTAEVINSILQLTNQARSRPRRCGTQKFPAVQRLSLNTRLSNAAREHARDMARHGTLEHAGTDGSTPASRVMSAGYWWRDVGENIASGAMTPEEVMEGWLASPGHCRNLMNPSFHELGVGYVVDAKSASGVYWTQVFATRRE